MAESTQALASPATWEEPDRAARTAQRLGETGLDAATSAELMELCAASADPDGALAGAARALAAHHERLRRPAPPASLAPLVTVCAASRFLAAHLAARPRLVDLLACPRFPEPSRRRVATAWTGIELAKTLRRRKLVEILRIALRDLSGRATLPESMAELSRLAESSLEAAVSFHYAKLCEEHGAPHGRAAAGPSGFCVLGMGKLGGGELNFSSDVDVLYVYDADGRTQGPSAIDHFAFYARLAEEVTRTIGSPSATPQGGFVFRVDLDLRPEGRSGPIANATRALELYYESQGAAWERFALLKARPVAGDIAVGEEALRKLAPFIWRKYLDLGAVEEMRALKARAEHEAGRRGGLDLKLGPGGIREVEFFVQALQLLHGGKDRNLRERGTLRALDRLLYAGLISSRDRDELGDGYLFLRRLEHRVQMVAERQTHALPEDRRERARLARRAGYPAPRDEALVRMERDLAEHRENIESRFGDLLRVAEGAAPVADANAAVAADPSVSDEERVAALTALGFANPEGSAAELFRLSHRRGTPFWTGANAAEQHAAPVLHRSRSRERRCGGGGGPPAMPTGAAPRSPWSAWESSAAASSGTTPISTCSSSIPPAARRTEHGGLPTTSTSRASRRSSSAISPCNCARDPSTGSTRACARAAAPVRWSSPSTRSPRTTRARRDCGNGRRSCGREPWRETRTSSLAPGARYWSRASSGPSTRPRRRGSSSPCGSAWSARLLPNPAAATIPSSVEEDSSTWSSPCSTSSSSTANGTRRSASQRLRKLSSRCRRPASLHLPTRSP